MSRGGKRSGAGRPKGVPTRKTKEIADRAAQEGITPLEVIIKIMRDAVDIGNVELALDAAKSAAPYIHPRLAAVEHSGPDGSSIKHQVTVGWMTEEEAKKRGWA